jgi:dethiobiotin synthetase
VTAGRVPGVFIAGTDTGSGKTRVTVGLLRCLHNGGMIASGMKPIASGTIETINGNINEDVAAIAAESRTNGGSVPNLDDINPYCFNWPVSPHIAAQRDGIEIDLGRIEAAYERLTRCCDAVIVEGTGGWFAPISSEATMADLARRLALPVVLVVGLRLGCLSHALLSVQAIERSGLKFSGWIASTLDPTMRALTENIETLRGRLPAPELAVLPHAIDNASDLPRLEPAARALFARGAAPV